MIKCIITSTSGIRTYKKLQSITLPAFFGQMQVLVNHTESFILLKSGYVLVKKTSGEQNDIQIPDGECYIKDNLVNIII